ncbi:MAG: hypothetical protein KKF65_04320 [Nanoarchaeota archaeon]|nr:hypothetical protein [Nanoarchaeota archaeon]
MDEINAFISKFTDYKITGITKIGRRYFFTADKQKELVKKINRDIFSIGIFIGEKKKDFQPTPALIEIISKHSNKKVFISEQAEWLFLCGRDVFDENIIKRNVDSGLVIVQNELDENLGYGKIISNKGKILIKNMIDKGNYLRREN